MPDIRQTVIDTLSARGPLPVAALARAAHRSVVAMRYHLALLARQGWIVHYDVERDGGVGRPQVRYALSERAHESLPKGYDALAGRLIEEVTAAYGDREARSILRRAGRAAAESAPPLRAGAGIESRLNRAAGFLSERGYLAHWERSADGLKLSACSCPFRQVALQHREVCDMDVAMVGALLGAPARMTHCIARQDGQCQFLVSPKPAGRRK
ncbi:MAG: hypothetical protein M1482_00585 [Chloroflexi bacterium]|nr:hypothetical protein [Chloroflexota bacterium]